MRSKTGISISVIPMSVVNVKRSLDKLATDTQKRIAQVIAEAGLTIQKDAKTNAPVDFGILRASIYFDYRGRVKDGKTGIGNIPESSRDGLNAIIGSRLEYAALQEEGRGAYLINRSVYIERVGWRFIGMHPGYKAQPYLGPAYNKTAPKVGPAIERQINEAIKKGF